MMAKRVLDVGNCGPDHASICRMLRSNFQVEIDAATNTVEALQALESANFDLILVNRKLDEDYSDGIEVIKAIKADCRYSTLPIMLITNYEEHQQQAIAIGAYRGFGKLSLASPQTIQLLAEILDQ